VVRSFSPLPRSSATPLVVACTDARTNALAMRNHRSPAMASVLMPATVAGGLRRQNVATTAAEVTVSTRSKPATGSLR
jgi:hypothetical protein